MILICIPPSRSPPPFTVTFRCPGKDYPYLYSTQPVASAVHSDPPGRRRNMLAVAGYHATASDQHESTDQTTKKVYGKLNITLSDVFSSPEGALWKAAVEDEIASHQKNGT